MGCSHCDKNGLNRLKMMLELSEPSFTNMYVHPSVTQNRNHFFFKRFISHMWSVWYENQTGDTSMITLNDFKRDLYGVSQLRQNRLNRLKIIMKLSWLSFSCMHVRPYVIQSVCMVQLRWKSKWGYFFGSFKWSQKGFTWGASHCHAFRL